MSLFVAEMPATNISAAKSLVVVTAPSSGMVVVTRASISNRELGTTQQLAASVVRTSSTGGGTAATAKPLQGTGSFGGSVIVNSTAEGSTGATLWHGGFNVLNGFEWVPTPDERPLVGPGKSIALKLLTAPSTATSLTASFHFAQLGPTE